MAAPETLAFVSCVVQTLNSLGEISAQGGLSLKSVMDLVKSLELAAPALKNIKSLPTELGSMSDSDRALIQAKIDSINVGQSSAAVDAALTVSLDIAEFICAHLVPSPVVPPAA